MKYLRFEYFGQAYWGITDGTSVLPIAAGDVNLDDVLARSTCDFTSSSKILNIDDIKFLPPILRSSKVICVGTNYLLHALETGKGLPKYPSLFLRHADSFTGHLSSIEFPSCSTELDYEAELAVVIGKPGRNIPEVNAMQYIAGYTCLAENSVRDFQRHSTQVTAGKNFDRSGSIGPWIVPLDDMKSIEEQKIYGRLNGVRVQEARLGDTIFSISKIISYVSQVMQLHPGDIIATGTPDGVGFKRSPPIFFETWRFI